MRISELSGRVTSSQWDKYKNALQAELKEAGFFSAARKRVRRNLLVGGGLLLAFGAAGVLLAGILSSIIGSGPLAVVGSVFVLAVVALISGASFSPLSDEGMDTAVAWKAFAKHLTNVSKGKEAVGSPDMFEQFLPYAASFGLLHPWAKHFEKRVGTNCRLTFTCCLQRMPAITWLFLWRCRRLRRLLVAARLAARVRPARVRLAVGPVAPVS
ncbi:MAG: DUF2207 domain-containing protein [Chloroflexi bacterium]|nr:DUF2207 domain-containing protein [Chloroflexota bacterium]